MRAHLLISLLLLLGAGLWAQSTMGPIEVNGPVSNRVNIVFLAEGYTSAQQAKFLVDATNLFNVFASKSPFAEYRSYLNAYAIHVASVQPGSDHPAYEVTADTYFNSTYDFYSDYLITIPTTSQGQGKIDALLQAHMPECDLPILLVNDTTTGGSDGFGRAAIVAIGAVPESSADLLAHEVGHVLANLGDEYTASYPGYPDVEEANTTRETRRDYIKWKAWISAETPVPTPETGDYSESVGLFEGAHYHETGWFRPKLDCAMNSFYSPFCEVCREALVLSFYGRVRPIESRTPAAPVVSVSSEPTRTFSVTTLQPASGFSFEWRTNGVSVPGSGTGSLNIPTSSLLAGQNTVTVLVKDQTSMVRTDPTNALSQTTAWTVQVNRLQMGSPHFVNGNKFVVRFAGAAPNGFVVQTSSNLAAWTSISTNYLVGGSAWVTNSSATGGQRFYRGLIRP